MNIDSKFLYVQNQIKEGHLINLEIIEHIEENSPNIIFYYPSRTITLNFYDPESCAETFKRIMIYLSKIIIG